MSSLNKVLLIGNLGKDPELKMTPSGKPICRFSLATTETWKDSNGKQQKKTEWHNIVIFGPSAEYAEKYLRKGSQAYIEGKMSYNEGQSNPNKDKVIYSNVVVDKIIKLDKEKGTEPKQETNDESLWDD